MEHKKWEAQEHDSSDKSFEIRGPASYEGGLLLYVDYDDVDHDRVEDELKKLLNILNTYW